MIIKNWFQSFETSVISERGGNNLFHGHSRLYYVIDGEAEYIEDGKKARLKKGYLYIIPAKTGYSLLVNSESSFVYRHVRLYTAPIIRKFIEAEVIEGTPLSDAVSLWGKYCTTDDKEWLANVLHLILYCVENQLVTADTAATAIKKYIDDLVNITNVDMKTISADLGYTREYITRTFTVAYKMTPMRYINSKKMERALHMLKEGKNVKETAYALGYSTPYSFSKAFKKFYFVTPKSYKSI